MLLARTPTTTLACYLYLLTGRSQYLKKEVDAVRLRQHRIEMVFTLSGEVKNNQISACATILDFYAQEIGSLHQ